MGAGYDCLVNVGYVADSWYLDNLDSTWDKAYGVDLRAAVPKHVQAKVLGGHGEMWGETVDPSDFDSTVWPRLAAIGERLWSDVDDARMSAEQAQAAWTQYDALTSSLAQSLCEQLRLVLEPTQASKLKCVTTLWLIQLLEPIFAR